MDVPGDPDASAARIAAAIGEPARARMLYCLSDGRARTSTELSAVAEVTPSTASVHLQRLRTLHLVKVLPQGKHRYYALAGEDVGRALEALSVLAGAPRGGFVVATPHTLREARSCYDHLAGSLGVQLHDRFVALRWLSSPASTDGASDVTSAGDDAFTTLGVDIAALRAQRRRFAFGCVDWSERRPHLGGALGAAVLTLALGRRWVTRNPDGRALTVTPYGRREMRKRFGLG